MVDSVADCTVIVTIHYHFMKMLSSVDNNVINLSFYNPQHIRSAHS